MSIVGDLIAFLSSNGISSEVDSHFGDMKQHFWQMWDTCGILMIKWEIEKFW